MIYSKIMLDKNYSVIKLKREKFNKNVMKQYKNVLNV